jgi:ferric-dicitrate binding protein FerR (iron transport regulator)
MRTEKELRNLLKKYQRGTISLAELKLLETWYHQTGDGETGIELTEARQAKMLRAVRRSTQPAKIIHVAPWRYAAAAASLALLVVCSWLLIRNESSQQPVEFVWVKTGQGEVVRITLPDSSHVWLNAQTSLAYNKNFRHNRLLRLDGEAMFTVTHDEQHPFRVQTMDSIETTVLGTQFNVSSYRALKQTQVVVLSGRVKVGKLSQPENGVLTKNDAIRFDQTTRQFTQFDVDTKTLADWRDGEWEIRNMAALSLLLQNQYGIHTMIGQSFPADAGININFYKKQSTEEIISTIALLTGGQYRWVNASTVEFY